MAAAADSGGAFACVLLNVPSILERQPSLLIVQGRRPRQPQSWDRTSLLSDSGPWSFHHSEEQGASRVGCDQRQCRD